MKRNTLLSVLTSRPQPTCHVNHTPGFIKKASDIKSKGVDVIAIMASNDPFVMSAWARVSGFKDNVRFLFTPHLSLIFCPFDTTHVCLQLLSLSDGNAGWSSKLGLTLDLTARGFGVRTARYALIIDDLVVKYIGVRTHSLTLRIPCLYTHAFSSFDRLRPERT